MVDSDPSNSVSAVRRSCRLGAFCRISYRSSHLLATNSPLIARLPQPLHSVKVYTAPRPPSCKGVDSLTQRVYNMGVRRPEAATASETMAPFQVGQTYYGSLSCAHGSFPVVCVRRTEKSVWFEHATRPHHYPMKRSKARGWGDGTETAQFHGWYISSDAVKDNGWDMSAA